MGAPGSDPQSDDEGSEDPEDPAGRVPLEALGERARRRAEGALESGELRPIASERTTRPEAGIPFCVRLAPGLAERERRATAGTPERRESAFLPWERGLFVGGLSSAHAAILNKFPVVPEHLLLVTRRFEPQEGPLGPADFEALFRALAGVDGVGFYNSGAGAGASQAHKHLQLVRGPLGEGPERAPVEAVLGGAEPAGDGAPGVCVHPALPFRHALARVEPPAEEAPEAAARAAETAWAACARLLELDVCPRPYNLLATREGLLAVPRSRAEVEGIPVNALAYAGALLVKREADLERLRREGPLSLLARAGEPRAAGGLRRPAPPPPR